MIHSWKKLTDMTEGKPLIIRKVEVKGEDLTVEGSFDPPPFTTLSHEEQLFVAAFIKTHGSIKQMEKIFGISYPTVKNRLNTIGSKLGFMDVKVDIKSPVSDILDRLETGEISAEQAVKEIE